MLTQGCFIETLGIATITLLSLAFVVPSISAAAAPPLIVNKNHTVGDTAGWHFDNRSNSPSADYSKWAASQTFYVGDFIIFSLCYDCSLVQTRNETTYSVCDTSMNDSNVIKWEGGFSSIPDYLPIHLTYEGPCYFFSYDMEGDYCRKGMKFGINVLNGQLLSAPNGSGGLIWVLRGGLIWVAFGILSLVFIAK